MGKQDDANAARLVQMNVNKATNALAAGETDTALGVLKSTDQLCDRVEAPPPLHALVVRLYVDAARKKRAPEVYAEVRSSLSRVVARNEEAEYRPGIPAELQMDLRARVAELLATWGEMERDSGDYGASAAVLEKAVQTFKRMGNAWEYMAATLNRMAVTHIEAGDGEAALAALKRAEEYAESVPKHQDQLMQQTLSHRGSAYARLGQMELAKENYTMALDMAHAQGREDVVAEISERLALFEQSGAKGGAPAEQPAAAAATGGDQYL
mmetsp:Transcript_942/g.2357  ORF Transcript_942/g.2357 Transcript_942/m.2357 type:complete len:268 (-) Transcript_942:112-915(-)